MHTTPKQAPQPSNPERHAFYLFACGATTEKYRDASLRTYREMYEVFFEERPLIPPERFHEIGFEELEADPVGELRKVYEALSLPDYGHVEPVVRGYLQTLLGYRKNALPELSAGLRERIGVEWRRYVESWGYDVAGSRQR